MRKNVFTKKLYSAAMAAAVSATAFSGIAGSATMFVSAAEVNATQGVVDMNQGGNASIKIQGNADQSMENKKFNVYKLFDAVNADRMESINYTWNPNFKHALQVVTAKYMTKDGHTIQANDVTEYQVIDYINSLNQHKVTGDVSHKQEENGRYSTFRRYIEDVRKEIETEGITGKGDTITVKTADNNNAVTISGLKFGYYIVDEISTEDSGNTGAEGNDYFASALIMVDTANPNAEMQLKSDYPSIIKKIQEDDNKGTVGNEGWNDVADYEIGQTVPYKYESTIPNLYGYDTYYYAMQDKMSDSLTFHNNKSEISITITRKTGNKSKSYTLKDNEYAVITDKASLHDGETFKLQISDIKAIIDKQLPGDSVDEDKRLDDYSGLTVLTTYKATLNEKAAQNTGRPGYENKVRLEFSNNPDSDHKGDFGHTPWDTVVAFSFKLNGSKVNNMTPEAYKLKGAKFRLYSDEACTQEVFVKAGDKALGKNPYIVINRDSLGGNDHLGGNSSADAVEMVSDENGDFNIYGLDTGVYYLKETTAPNGYRPLLDPITITVSATYDERDNYVEGAGATDKVLKTLTATAHIEEFYDGILKPIDSNLTTDLEQGSADLTVVNEVGAKLPVTGSSAMLLMLGAGLALCGGAVVVSRKKKVTK